MIEIYYVALLFLLYTLILILLVYLKSFILNKSNIIIKRKAYTLVNAYTTKEYSKGATSKEFVNKLKYYTIFSKKDKLIKIEVTKEQYEQLFINEKYNIQTLKGKLINFKEYS